VRAAVLTRAGLEIAEVPDPVPAAGEVLIEVRAVSASRLELEQTMTGTGLGAIVQLPRVLGMDPAGVIVAAGPGVDQGRVGQRVAVKPNLVCGSCAYCRNGAEADCPEQGVLGVHRDGGAAQLVTVPASLAFPVAGTLSFAAAAAAVHSVSVALHMLRAAGPLTAAGTVLVLGASGAVGSAAAQLAAHFGARVTTAVSDPATLPAAIGYDGLAACGPVDAVLDTTGDSQILTAAIGLLGWKGTAVTCASRNGPATVDIGALYRGRRTLTGVAASDFADVRDALSLVAAGAVVPRIAATFPLPQAAAAYAALADRRTPGKVLMVI
jgi:NADPH:quinone reductase-like Zn-dependent oxidoreductase